MNHLCKITRRDLGGGASPAVAAATAGATVVIVAGKKHKPAAVLLPFALAESLGVVTSEQVKTCPRFEPPSEE